MRYVLVAFIALLFILVVFLPWTVIEGLMEGSRGQWGEPAPGERGETAAPAPEGLTVTVFKSEIGKTETLPLEEYVVGVVAAEMPVSFHPEALKAQAVLARTYAVSKLPAYGGTGPEESLEADISDDPAQDQAWISDDQMRTRWGFFPYWSNKRRIEKAVAETSGLVVTYRGQLIEAVYHSTSGGKTECAEAVWGNRFPYLVSVPSRHEERSPYVETRHFFTWEELADRLELSEALLMATYENPHAAVVRIKERSPGGRVVVAGIVNNDFRGAQLRKLLNLPSTWWEARATEEGVEFEVKGFGHGVGLSQYGAEGYAERGWSFEEIIQHYYPGVVVEPLRGVSSE